MGGLLESRKFWIAIVAMVCVTVVVVVSLFLHVPEASMVTISSAIGGLAYKLIDGIAREDAAKVVAAAPPAKVSIMPPPAAPEALQ